MVNSATDICNLASDLLSAGTVNDVENPTSSTEEIFNRWYNLNRKKLLRKHPWNFATKRIILSPDSTDPAFGFNSQFTLPSDFIRLLYIATDLSTDRETILEKEAYQVEGGKILLNDFYGDSTQLRLVYTYDITNVSKFDPLFVDLLASEIALSVAYKITESNTNIERVMRLQKTLAAEAKAINGQERPPIRVERSRALSARRRGGKTRNTHRIYFD